jgi:hypothetical protein
VRMSRSNIRRRYNCDKIHSRKARTPEETALLEKRGGDILVLELQGVRRVTSLSVGGWRSEADVRSYPKADIRPSEWHVR